MEIRKTPRILQVSTYEVAGGAEKVALDLFQSYRSHGYNSHLAVGRKTSSDPDVFVIPNEEHCSAWTRYLRRFERYLSENHHWRLSQVIAALSHLRQYVETELGMENFDFPGTYRLLDLPPQRPNIVHAHNLHFGYFDLRALPWLTQQVPLVVSLHDAWLLSGHCAHSFDCERWQVGCGHCPDLRIYPPIKRDATAYNFRRKAQIYAKSRIHVATASGWLMRKVEQSILAPAIVETRQIPYGVDLSVFHPGNKAEARAELNISQDRLIILLRANSIRKDKWKDFQLMRTVVDAVGGGSHNVPVIFLALGEERPAEKIGNAEIRFVPFQEDLRGLAKYYQLADMYIHPARADTFPLAVLEALACGTPVVATRVGGIPEQIVDGVTGFLTPPGDSEAMANVIFCLLTDAELCKHMGSNAAEDARKRFSHDRHVHDYLSWYQEILEAAKR